MKYFLVILEGGPIQLLPQMIDTNKSVGLVGFISTRKAHAGTVLEAITLAIADTQAELREGLLAQGAEDPSCYAVEIRKLTWMEAVRRRYRGFTFYPWPITQ